MFNQLPQNRMPFAGNPFGGLTLPLMMFNTDTLCETAARLLFMNVRWAKTVPAFVSLPLRDQLTLLEESWREFFVLGAAQFNLPIELGAKLISTNQEANSSNRHVEISSAHSSGSSNKDEDISNRESSNCTEDVLAEMKACQEAMEKFREMGVDETEFACLRAIILFKSCSSADVKKKLKEVKVIEALQDQAQLTLSKYISIAYPTQPLRFGRLLLLLPLLKTVAPKTIENLFFRKTIGNISIEKIICDMYKSGL